MTKSNKNKSEKPEKMPDRSSFDAIFSPGSDDPDHMIGMALVNRFGYGNDIYLEGFHEAAETLFDSLGDSHSANILVYPLIFPCLSVAYLKNVTLRIGTLPNS